MKRNLQHQMITRGCRRPQIPQPQMRITRHRGNYPLCMWGPLGRVRAAVCRQGEDAAFAFRVPDLDRPVP